MVIKRSASERAVGCARSPRLSELRADIFGPAASASPATATVRSRTAIRAAAAVEASSPARPAPTSICSSAIVAARTPRARRIAAAAPGVDQAHSGSEGVVPHLFAHLVQIRDLCFLLVGQHGLDLGLLFGAPSLALLSGLPARRPLATNLANLVHLLLGETERFRSSFGYATTTPAPALVVLSERAYGHRHRGDRGEGNLLDVLCGHAVLLPLLVSARPDPVRFSPSSEARVLE